MSDVQFAEEVLARIRRRERRYHERGFLFVLAAIEFLQEKLPQRRHVTGSELAWACRDLALQQYGLLGLRAAQRCGVEVAGATFAAAARQLLAVQCPASGRQSYRVLTHAELLAAAGEEVVGKANVDISSA